MSPGRDKLRLAGNANARALAAPAWMAAQSLHPSRSWEGLCKMAARESYGIKVSRTGSAYACWLYAGSRHRHRWYTPPVGTPVFWAGGSHGFGHVGIADGTGRVWCNDFKRPGEIDLVSISRISNVDAALRYLGWTDTFDGVTVYDHP